MDRLDTIYFIHHSHTDIGYTHDQPIVWDLHRRFIDEAIDLAEADAGRPDDRGFRWTVETTAVFCHWLERAPARQIERFAALERAGRIEVTGMFANLTPLFDADQLVESFQPVRALRMEHGFDVRSAMNCDVNGQNWPLVDLLLDLGIEGFSMAINPYFGGAPMRRPNAFWWEGPSGRKLLAWNGWSYGLGLRFGIGRDATAFEQTWLPRIQQRLTEIDYPLPVLMVQAFHPVGDNGTAYAEFARFIDAWNARGKHPRLQMATPRMWWKAVRESEATLPTHRGDWTDYWNFGCASSAREQAINRASRARLRVADALAAVAPGGAAAPGAQQTLRSFVAHRETAWRALHLWDEHTWGADFSVAAPESEDAASQWHHKAHYAYTARSLSLVLQRDALAALAQRVARARPDDLLVFNPLPWPRVVAGEVPEILTGSRIAPEDATASRHLQDRMPDHDAIKAAAETTDGAVAEGRLALPPVEVPGFGYVVAARNDLVALYTQTAIYEDAVVENARYRLVFDRERGGVVSLYDKALAWEWVDPDAPYSFNGFVHEQVADRAHPQPRRLFCEPERWPDQVGDDLDHPRAWLPGWRAERTRPSRVLAHRVYNTPLGWHVVQVLEAPGCAGPLRQRVFLPAFADYIECEAWWDMGLTTHPEATYLLFPFNVPGAVARVDLGGQAMTPEVDQLPGVCRDYFTAQGWVDFSNGDLGVTVALPENPMVQLGDFHFAHDQARFALERAMLLSWVTNNYWPTNFRAYQPGRVSARYRITPYRGGFDEARAHRLGLEALHSRPLFQLMGEPAAPSLPDTGTLLHLPAGPVLTLHVKPAAHGDGIIVRLLNASDVEQPAEVRSGLLRVVAAQRCDLLEAPVEAVAVHNGAVALTLPPRRIVVLRLGIQ